MKAPVIIVYTGLDGNTYVKAVPFDWRVHGPDRLPGGRA